MAKANPLVTSPPKMKRIRRVRRVAGLGLEFSLVR
jgi:hypothetical protein